MPNNQGAFAEYTLVEHCTFVFNFLSYFLLYFFYFFHNTLFNFKLFLVILFLLIFHNTVFNFKLFFVILFLLIFHNTDTLYILFRFPFTISIHYFHSLSFFSMFINTLICHDQSGVRYSLILSSFVHFPYSTNTLYNTVV